MNIRDLKYLIMLAKHKHFGKAAKATFASQPTLSMQLKKLEEELGVSLFERTNKQLIITPQGQLIIEQAKKILMEIDQLYAIAQASKNPFSGDFRLGIIPTLSAYLLPYVIADLETQFEQLNLFFYEDKTEKILAKLHIGELDAVITALPIAAENCTSEQLFAEEFYLAIAANHPLVAKSSINYPDIINEPLLLLEEGHCLREQALTICRQTHSLAKVDFQATSIETLRYMVAAGTGISLFPLLAAACSNNSQVCYKAFNQPATRQIAISWRNHYKRKACVMAIAEIIKRQMQTKLPELRANLLASKKVS